MEAIKKALFQLLGGLFMENKEGVWAVSKGSIAFWILFGHCLYIWSKVVEGTVTDVSDGELYTLWALLGYGATKIGVGAVKDVVASIKGEKAAVSEEGEAP